jgi:hypothetical protein
VHDLGEHGVGPQRFLDGMMGVDHRAHLARRVAEAAEQPRPRRSGRSLEENQRLAIGRRGDAHHGGEGIRQDRRPLCLHGSEVGVIEHDLVGTGLERAAEPAKEMALERTPRHAAGRRCRRDGDAGQER